METEKDTDITPDTNLMEGLGDTLLKNTPPDERKKDAPPTPEPAKGTPSPEPDNDETSPAPEPEDDQEELDLSDIDIDGLGAPEGTITPDPDTEPPEPDSEANTMSEKDKAAFARLRTENVELKKQLESKADAVSADEVETLKKQLEQANMIIGKVSVENHPEFQQKYTQPVNILIDQAKNALKQFNLDEGIAERAKNMNLVDRTAYLAENASEVAAAITPVFGQIDIINAQRDSELANYEQTLEVLHQRDQENQVKQITQLKETHFNTAMEALRQEGAIGFVPSKSEAHNANVTKLTEAAKRIFLSDDPQLQTKMILEGVHSVVYKQLFNKVRADNKILEAELAKLGQARPKLSTSKRDSKLDKDKKPERLSSRDVGSRIKLK